MLSGPSWSGSTLSALPYLHHWISSCGGDDMSGLHSHCIVSAGSFAGALLQFCSVLWPLLASLFSHKM